MTDYSFTTLWQFNEPIEAVWDEICHPERWPQWWKYVEDAQELEPGDDLGIGSIWKYSWKTKLFYKFSFIVETVLLEPPYRLEGLSRGDLEGSGKWYLESSDNKTTVRYKWIVKTNKMWMNLLYPVAYPLFKWNHNSVMDEGFKGLSKKLCG